MPDLGVEKYAWLSDPEASAFGLSGCVTVVVGDSEEGVLAAFGADIEQGLVYDLQQASEQPSVAVLAVGSAVVALEVNGFEGSRTEVLRVASKHGKAASVCWNEAIGMIWFGCARRGKVLSMLELQPGELGDENLPRRLVPFLLLMDDEDVDPVALGAAMIEKFTGVAIPRAPVAGVARAYAVHPQLEDLRPANPAHLWVLRGRRDVVEAVVAADPARHRALAQWAAAQAARQCLMTDDPGIASMIDQFGQGRPCALTPEFMRLVIEVQRTADTLQSRDPSRHGGYSMLPLRRSRERIFAVRAFRHLTVADDTAAALGVLDCARGSMAVDGGSTLLLDEAIRLVAMDPHRWADEADALPEPTSADERAAAIEWERTKPERDAAEARARFQAWRDGTRQREASPGRPPAGAGTTGGPAHLTVVLSSSSPPPTPKPPLGQPPRVGFLDQSGDVVIWRDGQPVVLANLGVSAIRPWAWEAASGVIVNTGLGLIAIRADGNINTLLKGTIIGRVVLNEAGTRVAVGQAGPGSRWQLHVIDLADGATVTMPAIGRGDPVQPVGFYDGAIYVADAGALATARPSRRWIPGSPPEQLDYWVLQLDPTTGTIHARDTEPGTFLLSRDESRARFPPVVPENILAPSGRYLYTSKFEPPTIRVVDTSNGASRDHVLPSGCRTESMSPLQPVWDDADHLLIQADHAQHRLGVPVIRLAVDTGHIEGVSLAQKAVYRPTLIVPLPRT